MIYDKNSITTITKYAERARRPGVREALSEEQHAALAEVGQILATAIADDADGFEAPPVLMNKVRVALDIIAEFAEMVGAVPVIPTKINTVITDPEDTAWGRLIERNEDQSAFNLYFLRNNAESVYSTIERLFQKHIRTAHPVA